MQIDRLGQRFYYSRSIRNDREMKMNGIMKQIGREWLWKNDDYVLYIRNWMDVYMCVYMNINVFSIMHASRVHPYNRGRGALRERYTLRPSKCICVGGELYAIKNRYVIDTCVYSTIHSELRMIPQHSVKRFNSSAGSRIVHHRTYFSYNAPIMWHRWTIKRKFNHRMFQLIYETINYKDSLLSVTNTR